jgi:hypothetical protein
MSKGNEVNKTIEKSVVSLFTACVLLIAVPFATAATVNISNAGVTAWSTTGAGSTFEGATLGSYSGGFGVTNTAEDGSTPEHSMDNFKNTDLLEFNFAQAIDLDSVTIGWSYSDSDISILAYTGAATGTTPDLGTKSIAQLLTSGWSFVGQYSNLAVGTATSVNPLNVSSKYWLVSSYNAGYAPAGTTALTASDDYVKILQLSGTVTVPPPSKVPEPGSLALFAAAALGLFAVRRRRSQPQAQSQRQPILRHC